MRCRLITPAHEEQRRAGIILWPYGHNACGCVLQRWQHPRENLPAIAFAPDSAALAVGGDDGVVRLFDVLSGKEQRRIEIAEVAIKSLACSAQSELISRCADGLIRIDPTALLNDSRWVSYANVRAGL